MKNIFKIITLLIVTSLVAISCDYDENNYDALTKDIDANATYYVQFKKASKNLETGVSITGGLVEVVTPIEVALLGTPLSTPLEINLSVDASTTLTTAMYTLSASKITIPAGGTSGSITLTTKAASMPIDVPLKFVLNISQGEHNAPAGTKLTYTVKRINFCPWTVDEMVGNYTGTDYDGYSKTTMTGAKFKVAKVSNTQIAVSGFLQGLYIGQWGETVTGGDKVILNYVANGKFTTFNQYLCQTDNVWDYYFGPDTVEMKWDGCNKTMDLRWKFHWDDGYADNYPSRSVITKD
ncbi:MAG: hypothetical protein OEL54_02750 [Flavobacteriaceae bacterium]|nr:hypothetical protein [Flavobacteriaceae bacterium]